MQDFLLTPLLREAVTYKLAHQIHNLRPEKEYALGPLDMFPAGIADAADWRNLIFGGWWSWLEKWGKLVSIFLGVYYLYVVGRWLLTTLFSLRVLYQEHGFTPQPTVGIGAWTGRFPNAILPPLEVVQATFRTRRSSAGKDASAASSGLRALATTGTPSARVPHCP